jgi:hypothetical protein
MARAGLWQAFHKRGWSYPRFNAALEGLRDLGPIDVVVMVMRNGAHWERLEVPLKD